MKWVSTKLSEVASFQAGNAWKSSDFNDKGLGLPVIRIQNVTDSNVSDFVFWDLDFDLYRQQHCIQTYLQLELENKE